MTSRSLVEGLQLLPLRKNDRSAHVNIIKKGRSIVSRAVENSLSEVCHYNNAGECGAKRTGRYAVQTLPLQWSQRDTSETFYGWLSALAHGYLYENTGLAVNPL